MVENGFMEVYGWCSNMFLWRYACTVCSSESSMASSKTSMAIGKSGRRYANLSVDKTAVYVNARCRVTAIEIVIAIVIVVKRATTRAASDWADKHKAQEQQ